MGFSFKLILPLYIQIRITTASCFSLNSNSGLKCKLERKRHSHSILNPHSDTLSAREIKSDLSANPPRECVHASIKALHGQESLIHTLTNSHIHIHCVQLTSLRSVSEVWHHIRKSTLRVRAASCFPCLSHKCARCWTQAWNNSTRTLTLPVTGLINLLSVIPPW